MAHVKFSRVISVSSEDSKYPGDNLLKSDISSCWKCKNVGEKQAVIILQLEKLSQIHSIHIGNENSAFIEILVSRSAAPDVYEVLQVASLLMSVKDAKSDKNKNVVRFFEYEGFSKPIANQSWDRIKIVCSQPFNKYIQYGLSFIKVYSKPNDTGEKRKDNIIDTFTLKKKELAKENDLKNNQNFLGKFMLKENEGEDQIVVGSFFARKNEISKNISTAVAIRAASNDPKNHISNTSKRLSDVLHDLNDSKRKRKNVPENNDMNDYRRSVAGSLLYKDNLLEEECVKNESKTSTKEQKQNENEKATNSASVASNSPKVSHLKKNSDNMTSEVKQRIIKEEFKKPKRKPFNRLLEDVVFVISGYQNPLRSELRSKALQMGAKYKVDWNSTCTHLICAFTNTPKSNQVRGNGWIVSKNWIEDCYSLRKRLLCYGYILDKSDTYSKSDEEIWEQTDNENTDLPNLINNSESADLSKNCYSNEANNSKTICTSKLKKNISEDDIFNADTDVDSDYSNSITESNYETINLKVLPEFFETKNFYLGTDLEKSLIKILKRYIISFKGNILDNVDNVNYIISGDTKYKEIVTNTPVVLPDWIWECNDQRTLVPIDDYVI